MTNFICPLCGDPAVIDKTEELGYLLYCRNCGAKYYAKRTAELGKYYLEEKFNPSKR